MQMERRISVIEPHEDDQPSFDPLERSRNGWASLSAPGKSKVELSGNVVMGSALLYSTASQDMSCMLSCVAAHSTTSAGVRCTRWSLEMRLRCASHRVQQAAYCLASAGFYRTRSACHSTKLHESNTAFDDLVKSANRGRVCVLMVQEQDEQRAASSLDQTGVSTSTSMTLDIKTDLGGPESGGLHAQCILDADKSQAHLQKV